MSYSPNPTSATPSELLTPVEQLDWAPLVPGIDFRLLFASGETGRWTDTISGGTGRRWVTAYVGR